MVDACHSLRIARSSGAMSGPAEDSRFAAQSIVDVVVDVEEAKTYRKC